THPVAWDNLIEQLLELQDALMDLLAAINQAASLPNRSLWIQPLNQAREELRKATESYDTERLQAGLGLLRQELKTKPGRINVHIVATARFLPLADLKDKIALLCDWTARPQEFQRDLEDLTELDKTLDTLVSDHDFLQQWVANQLIGIEPLLDQDLDGFRNEWHILDVAVQTRYHTNQGGWARKLLERSTELEGALLTESLVKIKSYFQLYRKQVSKSLKQVDTNLLDLCKDLKKFGEMLDRVLKIL
ncbi:MAG: hypothetical protein L0Y56_16470, partial [Nitrospira sp.]|nr:hypothetical protein [Nitrospira sp.]